MGLPPMPPLSPLPPSARRSSLSRTKDAIITTTGTGNVTGASAADAVADILFIPPVMFEEMEAGVFRNLCKHLRDRSDAVANITLMTVSGFCRNCLAKWMVLEARALSDLLKSDEEFASKFFAGNDDKVRKNDVHSLDALGYDEAAREVYGCMYPEWKKRHQKKSTEEQMQRYTESASLHAKHDAGRLRTKAYHHGNQSNYCRTKLSRRTLTRLLSGAFKSLCQHLRDRSDTVQNVELMTISGFCRNCLAKWLIIEAHAISDRLGSDPAMGPFLFDIIFSLDEFGYDEAAQAVYGCTYLDWKKRHQIKATDKQMDRYNTSFHLHANHDRELIKARARKPASASVSISSSVSSPFARQRQSPNASVRSVESHGSPGSGSRGSCISVRDIRIQHKMPLLSDVCCEDVDTIHPPDDSSKTTMTMEQSLSNTTVLPPPRTARQEKRPVLAPPKGGMKMKVAILTVSDRAASNSYESGDLGGPAVEGALLFVIDEINSSFVDQKVEITISEKIIVPDESQNIQDALKSWSNIDDDRQPCDLVFTTGGTGFAPRDVTPEATLSILNKECRGLMTWASLELTEQQPLAPLSRAVAGVRGRTLIVNLPGNPAGAAQVVEVLLPLILHAVQDLQRC